MKKNDSNCPHFAWGHYTLFYKSGAGFLDAEMLFLCALRVAMPGLRITAGTTPVASLPVSVGLCLQSFSVDFAAIPGPAGVCTMVRYPKQVSETEGLLSPHFNHKHIPGAYYRLVDRKKYPHLVGKHGAI